MKLSFYYLNNLRVRLNITTKRFLLLCFSPLLLVQCAKVTFQEVIPEKPVLVVKTPIAEPVIIKCSPGELKDKDGKCYMPVVEPCSKESKKTTSTLSLTFPKPQKSCDWNSNGNLSQQNGAIRARLEQTIDISIPKGSTVCSFQPKFPSQRMKYDDHIILTFNDYVISTTHSRLLDYLNNRGTQIEPIYEYSWEMILGNGYNDGYLFTTSSMCLDYRADKKCFWPQTQKTGTVDISVDPKLIEKISALSKSKGVNQFKLITLGDNDDKTDCQHEPINFQVEIEYSQ